jgi:hypothetical protein
MAIQVSGTEVISNARALNNIASVDATTAASITAAGVGGVSFTAGSTYIISRMLIQWDNSNTNYQTSRYPINTVSWYASYPQAGFANVGGTLRLSGGVSSKYTYNTVTYRILKNGSQYGSERTHQNTVTDAFTTFTWDVAVSAGDYIEIQGKSLGWPYYFKNIVVLSGSPTFGGFHFWQ